MKTALFLSEYDLSTVYYLCSFYMDNADLDFQDKAYINELQKRVDDLMKEHIDLSLEENAEWDNPEVMEVSQ